RRPAGTFPSAGPAPGGRAGTDRPIIGLTAPRQKELGPSGLRTPSFWESFVTQLELGTGMLLMIAVPSILVILLCGLARQTMDVAAFRTVIAVLLMLPTLILLAADIAIYFWVQAAVQVLFASVIMPVPLVPAQGAEQGQFVHTPAK
ncbi:hypothetical protein AB0K09_25630, partial [Streptomyces sp. NPDC049577]|uniref:hypothetical protein n=1 Tax=Streptomyces sp. NPDC049577 TaxID=3155153 RepID=UPI0034424301